MAEQHLQSTCSGAMPQALPLRAAPMRPASRWVGALAAVLAGAVLVAGVAPALGPAAPAAGALFASASLIMLAGLRHGHPHDAFGPANAVTLVRLALAASLVAAVPAPDAGPSWVVAAVAALALALDGLDGWLARQTGLASRFGARFDMEVDCLLALVLAAMAAADGTVGVWVLALGLARYAFWGASLALPWLSRPLPARQSRKVVCVVQMVALIALVMPPVQPPLAAAIAAAALAAVLWSFAVDIRHLHRQRA